MGCCEYTIRYKKQLGIPNDSYYIIVMNHYIELKSNSLDKLLKVIPRVIIMIGSSHCPSCREILGETFNTFAKENTDITFIYVDSMKFPDTVKKIFKIGLSVLPTFVYYVGNEYKGYIEQVTSLEVMKETLTNL